MDSYKSIKKDGTSRFEDRKSIFLGFTKYIETEQEAIDFISSIKKQYPDAKHHVYAYQIEKLHVTRFTDDGEPQGTAGAPLLDLLRKGELTNICLVVVRYFGGTLLGTGGLVHAYTQAGKDAISDGIVTVYSEYEVCEVTCSYPNYQRILTQLNQVQVLNRIFEEDVVIEYSILQSHSLEFQKQLISILNNQLQIEIKEHYFGCEK